MGWLLFVTETLAVIERWPLWGGAYPIVEVDCSVERRYRYSIWYPEGLILIFADGNKGMQHLLYNTFSTG